MSSIDPKGGPLGSSYFDILKIRQSDGSQHRIAGDPDQPREDGTHIVREGGPNSPIDYARINGVVLTTDQIKKINEA